MFYKVDLLSVTNNLLDNSSGIYLIVHSMIRSDRLIIRGSCVYCITLGAPLEVVCDNILALYIKTMHQIWSHHIFILLLPFQNSTFFLQYIASDASLCCRSILSVDGFWIIIIHGLYPRALSEITKVLQTWKGDSPWARGSYLPQNS